MAWAVWEVRAYLAVEPVEMVGDPVIGRNGAGGGGVGAVIFTGDVSNAGAAGGAGGVVLAVQIMPAEAVVRALCALPGM